MKNKEVLKLRFKVLKNENISILLRIGSIVLFFSFFVIFRTLDQKSRNQVSQNISAILRNEISVSNSYAISKTIVDLENIGIFSCAKLTEIEPGHRVFYDTVLGKKCDKAILSKLISSSYVLQGLNGVSYELYFIPKINWFAYLFEGMVYIIIVSLGVFLPGYFLNLIKDEQSKNAILEIQSKSLTDLTNQIAHDVASPLSAIRMITKLLTNVDPTVKDVLIKSVDRTQKIFDELKQKKENQNDIPIARCLAEIVAEKNITWGNSCRFQLNFQQVGELRVFGNESDFKRIVSNLLNNAYESFCEGRPGVIEISLDVKDEKAILLFRDNGKGMSADTLKKLGTRGYSVGKENHSTSGSGIGVHHAMSSIISWGGELNYSSVINEGTSAEMRLRVIQS